MAFSLRALFRRMVANVTGVVHRRSDAGMPRGPFVVSHLALPVPDSNGVDRYAPKRPLHPIMAVKRGARIHIITPDATYSLLHKEACRLLAEIAEAVHPPPFLGS